MSGINIQEIRNQFPSLQKAVNDRPIVYLDGPGGTQVPQPVIDAIAGYYENHNANTHGYFKTSAETDQVIAAARRKAATLLGAPNEQCISFGQNMTTLTYSLSHGLARMFHPGDEVLITQLDHEANRGPWRVMEEKGVVVKEVKLDPETGMLDYDDFDRRINEKTRLVAVGGASNAIGTVNDLQWIRKKSHQVNALMYVDAVHLVPHYPVDVQKIDCEFLTCSAYKFYGPHVGILYTREGLLNEIPVDRLRTQDHQAPGRIETGTLNHAALAGVSAAIDFIASTGNGESLRSRITNGMFRIGKYEHHLAKKLYEAIHEMTDTDVVGLPVDDRARTPTLSFCSEKIRADEICRQLGKKGICAWHGHFYAIRVMEVLDLLEKGGVTRLGISVYNTEEEIDYTIKTLQDLL